MSRWAPEPIVERLARQTVVSESGCWLWTGAKSRGGYGVYLQWRAVDWRPSRAYELARGPIPAGLTIDHLCGNPSCVNPEHLAIATQQENNNRGSSPPALNARKTECKHGHVFDEQNTYLRPKGGRTCRACKAESSRKIKAARKREALSTTSEMGSSE